VVTGMDKTKSINRLFFGMTLWMIAAPYLLGRLLIHLSVTQLNVAGEFIFMFPVILYMVFKRIRPKEWIPFQTIRISTVLMSALAAFLLLPLITFINAFSMLFATNYVSETGALLMGNPLWVNLMVMAVIPAVVEELIYRGIFYHAYREKGVILGTLASAVVFGLAHRNLNQFFYAAVLGLAFCMLVEITGSIYASMTAHFVINGWSVVLMHLQETLLEFAGSGGTAVEQAEITQESLLGVMLGMGILALFSTALAAGVMIWMAKHCKREAHMRWCFKRHELPEGVKRSFVTPAFAAAAAVGVAYMILQETGLPL